MDATSVTVGIPVADLSAARAWYDRVFGEPPSLEPAPGIVEYKLAGTWVQLMGGRVGAPGWVLRYGVDDLDAERERLQRLGVATGDVETLPGVIRWFGFHDPEGNVLSCYCEL